MFDFSMESVYDSIEFEGASNLRKYKRQLKKINKLKDYYRKMSLDDLQKEALSWTSINLKNKKQITKLYALAREVCFRLLGKFHYDVQILGALAALERQMIQMSTGSGKTLTLILPTLAYGLTHKGVSVLTVNEYLSERDWKETRVIYDFFGLTNMYVSGNDKPHKQNQAFNCDITYCTNSTLGFAYLNSNLASGINHDIKPISRPLHATIIDEVDEILMDDARNPLIIAQAADLGAELDIIEHEGRVFKVQEILDKLRTLKALDYDMEDKGEPSIGDKAWDEIYELFDVGDEVFENQKFVHVIHNCIEALFKQKAYEDYVVLPEPDPDSGSRVCLIDKATGRLARGRTLNDDLHAFVEMKEGVFTGSGSTSSMQITYQVLFNLFPHVTGVTGTLGKSYKEFVEIYNANVIQIPDRVPNKLKQQTHLFVTKRHLFNQMLTQIRLYQASRHPILIGAASDVEAEMISTILNAHGVEHKLLISTDDNEEVVIASAGEVGSIVVTTDIMGRGTDIHIHETDYERGLVVLQVGSRPNSRVERQFAGRAARQGDPGRYHRLLTLPELEDLGVMETTMNKIVALVRKHRDYINDYNGDVLLDGAAPCYTELVGWIDEALTASESSLSQQRIQDFRVSNLADLIQVSIVYEMDKYRNVVKEALSTQDMDPVLDALAVLSLPEKERKKKRLVKESREEWVEANLDNQKLLETLFNYTEHMVHQVIPQIREYSEMAMKTANLSQLAKMETKPEYYFSNLMAKFMDEIKEQNIIPYPPIEEDDEPERKITFRTKKTEV